MSSDLQTQLAEIGGRIRAAREASGLSYRALSEAAGVSLSTIQRAEVGGEVTIGTLHAIAGACGVTLAYLVVGGKPGRKKK